MLDAAKLQATWRQIDIELTISAAVASDPLNVANSGGSYDGYDFFDKFFQWQSATGVAENTVYVGFTPELDGNILGLAAVGFPYIIAQSERIGVETATYVVAHEIGHALGADHYDASSGPLNSSFLLSETTPIDPYANGLPNISDGTAVAARNSPMLADAPTSIAAIPVPFSMLMLASGILGLIIIGMRR